MSTRRGSCMHPKTMAKWTAEERTLMFSDFNFIGAYLWSVSAPSSESISQLIETSITVDLAVESTWSRLE